MRIVMTVAGKSEFVVKLASGHEPVALQRGAEVQVGWEAGDCRAYCNA